MSDEIKNIDPLDLADSLFREVTEATHGYNEEFKNDQKLTLTKWGVKILLLIDALKQK